MKLGIWKTGGKVNIIGVSQVDVQVPKELEIMPSETRSTSGFAYTAVHVVICFMPPHRQGNCCGVNSPHLRWLQIIKTPLTQSTPVLLVTLYV